MSGIGSRYSAASYSIRQNVDGDWVRASEEPLIDRRCNSEEEAFEHLWNAEQSGDITRLAGEAIDDYGDSGDSDDISDDDMPF